MNSTTADIIVARISKLELDLETAKGNYDECLDTIWMLLAALLVFFMHAGFSLLEAGSVRFKNIQNILSKNLLVVTIGFLCWYAVGWPLAYGALKNPNTITGGKEFFMDGFMDDKTKFRQWFFQGAFCATGGTIVSGAMAERTQLKGFAIYIIVMTAFIYPYVVYWGWSGSGFLSFTDDDQNVKSVFGPAYMDFAGSGLVHLTGGVGALLGASFAGPRKGRFEQTVDQSEFGAQNIPFCVLGTFCLWFGWYGFNPGSTLSMHDKDTAYTAGIVAVNTTISPCMAGITVFLLRALVVPPQLLDVGAFCNGILAGLVAITAGCAAVQPWEAAIIGLIGGFVYQGTSMIMIKCKVDDVVDAFAVHGANGIWGVLAVGLFGNPKEGRGGNGLFYGGDQLITQFSALLVIFIWVGGVSLLVFLPLKHFNMLRLDDYMQDVGADIVKHSPDKAFTMTDSLRGADIVDNSPDKAYATTDSIRKSPATKETTETEKTESTVETNKIEDI